MKTRRPFKSIRKPDHKAIAVDLAKEINAAYNAACHNIIDQAERPTLDEVNQLIHDCRQTWQGADICIDEEAGWLVSFTAECPTPKFAFVLLEGMGSHLRKPSPHAYRYTGVMVGRRVFIRLAFTDKARSFVAKELGPLSRR